MSVTEKEGRYAFYEAKFHKEPVDQSVILKEIGLVENSGFNCTRYGFFSRSGFSSVSTIDETVKQKLILFDLNDMF